MLYAVREGVCYVEAYARHLYYLANTSTPALYKNLYCKVRTNVQRQAWLAEALQMAAPNAVPPSENYVSPGVLTGKEEELTARVNVNVVEFSEDELPNVDDDGSDGMITGTLHLKLGVAVFYI